MKVYILNRIMAVHGFFNIMMDVLFEEIHMLLREVKLYTVFIFL